ncbi:ATP-dependent DNA helicase RecG [candidate division KSB3 bacterium]|uniref:ATP-dependent DNA helicase RecG n=1 Tax=candidate division KSB3 bacterium TaxID=2044937 RepID=A0A2G6E081_9BACT|nr:MAG: ATP-dependent DNA helicase RecG [candidate division KSB3 bacterium]
MIELFREQADIPLSSPRLGLTKALCTKLEKLGLRSVQDALLHLPLRYENRKDLITLGSQEGSYASHIRVIATSYIGFGAKRTLKAQVVDAKLHAGGKAPVPVDLLCFGRQFLARSLKEGAEFWFYGKVQASSYDGRLQASSFELEAYRKDQIPKAFGYRQAIYPKVSGLSQAMLGRIMKKILALGLPLLKEADSPKAPEELQGLSPERAFRLIHSPQEANDAERGIRYLAWWELSLYFAELEARKQARISAGISLHQGLQVLSPLSKKLIQSLPFKLTEGQKQTLKDIAHDFKQPYPMARLIAGEVGSGKTLLGLIAALPYIEAQKQVAFLVPTSILAKQHYKNASKLLTPLGIKVALLTGATAPKEAKEIKEDLAQGVPLLLIGTHALISKDMLLPRLSLLIIDEQQRFGVQQRASLIERSKAHNPEQIAPDLLLMTATPIPRTLALSIFGDLEFSAISEVPHGRKSIITEHIDQSRARYLTEFLAKELDKGHQVYVIYPRIEEGDAEKTSKLKDASSMAEKLSAYYKPHRVGLIHGRMKREEQEQIMQAFYEGKIKLLVATTVVEIGIDVPNATCMVIEHAERYGLSTLHPSSTQSSG